MKELDKSMYLSTGEFAKAAGIQRKHLIYYDQIGLFSPELILDNGYRYYFYRQLYTLNLILTLKEIGMSLSDIGNFIKERNPEKMIALFEQQQLVIQEEIDKLLQIKNMMTMQINSTKLAQSVSVGTIQIIECDEEPIFLGDIPLFVEGEQPLLSKMISRFYQYASSQGYECTFPWGMRIQLNRQQNIPVEKSAQFYYRVPESTTYKPAGRYIVLYSYGIHGDREETYKKITDYAKKYHYQLTDFVYEDSLLNEISTCFPENYILQISVKIDE
ncbi:MerR family transcriptional regulator [Enterococcus sp. LJL51]|uniref:MerR family transcriptional regulator n=1 Tax=Enterococcus sp. LJL51 TaxID=3416656 RepID=UPI003CEB8213